METKDSKKEKRKEETEAVAKELETELARLREDRIRARQLSKKIYLSLLVAACVPLLITRDPLYWLLSIAVWVSWIAMTRARRRAKH